VEAVMLVQFMRVRMVLARMHTVFLVACTSTTRINGTVTLLREVILNMRRHLLIEVGLMY
jgi:hypothetical protein